MSNPASLNQDGSHPQPIGCLYLHGFLSSPQSAKAEETRIWFEQHEPQSRLLIPTLPFEFTDAIAMARQQLRQLQQSFDKVMVIGSSLGGFYATRLAQDFDVPAVLINPAVRPHELFRNYLGPVTHYHTGVEYQLTERHLNDVAAIAVQRVRHPDKLLVLLQTGDETLDYRHAAELYQDCQLDIAEGGDHAYQGYREQLPRMIEFGRLA